jgi:hypothetical protein
MAQLSKPRRTRIERGIYQQANGSYAVCVRRAGRLHFRTAGPRARGSRRAFSLSYERLSLELDRVIRRLGDRAALLRPSRT